jgi:Lon protease-like protein
MSINVPYKGPGDLPDVVPVFPLEGALLLPRGELPLNIFEPRYLAMVDDALRTHRLIGMIQPQPSRDDRSRPALCEVGCLGRITQFAETGDGRYVLTLTGIARFHLREEAAVPTPYRQCRIDFGGFDTDFVEGVGEDDVDRAGVVRTLRDFASTHDLEVDWSSIEAAENETLVNALSMMCPFGAKEKQALLEASSLKLRADVLIAITERDLARADGATPSLQ